MPRSISEKLWQGSLSDILGAEGDTDLGSMSPGACSPVASPQKAASPPATPPRPPPLKMPDGNEAVNAGIAGASSGTPKRKKVEYGPFIDTLCGKEYVQKFLSARDGAFGSPTQGLPRAPLC